MLYTTLYSILIELQCVRDADPKKATNGSQIIFICNLQTAGHTTKDTASQVRG